MKPVISRHTKYTNGREVTFYYVFGMPVFGRVIIDKTEDKHRRVGYTVGASDAPTDCADDAGDEEDFEQYIIEPYARK